jgi:predicted Na+-dependent transporter
MLAAYAQFIREKYTVIIISTLLVAILVGLFTPAPGIAIRKISTFLIVIMIGAMGFTITFKSLGMAARDWKSFLLGLVLNFAFAPLLCWLLALLLLSNHPDLATGLILIGVVPCAGMALVWAGLLKGDVPLATVINAATMLVAPFLIPLLMRLFAGTFVSIDTAGMFRTVMLTVLLPVLAGVTLRELVQRSVDVRKHLPVMPAISATAAVLLMFMAINTAVPAVAGNPGLIGPLVASTILVFPVLFLVAYLISIKLLPRGKNIAITFSSGMKNLPIAVGIAVMSFKGLVMFPIAVAFAFQMLTAVSFYQLFLRTLPAGSPQTIGPSQGVKKAGGVGEDPKSMSATKGGMG